MLRYLGLVHVTGSRPLLANRLRSLSKAVDLFPSCADYGAHCRGSDPLVPIDVLGESLDPLMKRFASLRAELSQRIPLPNHIT